MKKMEPSYQRSMVIVHGLSEQSICSNIKSNLRLPQEIISRDNEVSLLRKTEPDKAYFNCHTDITIPYEEIGDITVVGYDGERTAIIKNGRFVLDGTKELNEPFEE